MQKNGGFLWKFEYRHLAAVFWSCKLANDISI